ncbi:Protein-L-isoaspartate O-methyltransferase 1 [Frankliniella fusca]|uniref:Protein-L-isoaspartate O-methyltransferase 1 n=1 Tax=Frankliniella fusca TaxID=407009 RepID=A0AAE1HT58_9NEOP|nr:Protein-L-isoaspartate O-methyltransferase 1 [Frankliniella fusca]
MFWTEPQALTSTKATDARKEGPSSAERHVGIVSVLRPADGTASLSACPSPRAPSDRCSCRLLASGCRLAVQFVWIFHLQSC